MNQIDTPRTKAAINASGGQWSFVLLDCSSELERELAAVTEQRDEALKSAEHAKAYKRVMKLENRNLRQQLAVAMSAISTIEERYIDGCDTYEDWKFMGDTARTFLEENSQAQARPSLPDAECSEQPATNKVVELNNQLTAVTEQRDRLAEDLKQIYNVSLFDYDTMPEAARKKYREVVFAIADKALQSLNQPTQ